MRVLLVNRVGVAEGGERNHYVLDLALRLRAMGDEVALVHGRYPPSQFRGTGYIYDQLDAGGETGPVARERLMAIADDFAPDVIQLHDVGNVAVDGWLAARAPTVRFAHNHEIYCSGRSMTLRGPRRPCGRAHGRGCLACHFIRQCGAINPVENWLRYARIERGLKAARALHGWLAVSPLVRDNLVRNGVDPGQIEVVPPYAPPPAAARRRLAQARRIVLHPGGMVRNKGAWLMARGLKDLPADVELVFAGGGDQKERIADWVKSQGWSERIRIMGSLEPDEWSELYHQASLVVFPSRWNEPLGLCGLHAMAHGKPVVAFDGTGVGHWLEEGVNGHLVRFNDAEAFVAKVCELLGRPERMAAMGKAGEEKWRARFRPEIHLERVRDYHRRLVYGAVAGGAGGR